jgi:peptidoglycan-associated lipoprotein
MNVSRLALASLLSIAALSSAACADSNKTAAPKTPASSMSVAQSPASDARKNANAVGPKGDASVETPGLHVSDAIARACGLPKQEVSPSFEFDSAAIGDADRTVLTAIARCLSEGPLRGSAVSLTGRADSRGEEEYNMTLGEARADSVRRYLHDLGVQEERLRATSRGEIDATGQDEAGWAHDRRVDIDLAN